MNIRWSRDGDGWSWYTAYTDDGAAIASDGGPDTEEVRGYMIRDIRKIAGEVW